MTSFVKRITLCAIFMATPAMVSAESDLESGLNEIVKTAQAEPATAATLVSALVCPDGKDLTALLVTGLKDRGIQAQSQTERQKELEANVQTEKTSQGYQWLVSGSCIDDNKTQRLQLKLTELESGRIIASYSSPSGSTAKANPQEAQSLLTQLRKLSDQVIKNLNSMDGNLRYQRFAVADFQEIGASTQDKELGLVVSAQLQSMLQNDHNLFLVERQEVAKIMEEIQLGQMGLVSEKDAVEIGKMSGAQALILGSVSEAGAQYIVNTKIVSVNEAKVWATAQTTLPAADLIALSSEAAVLRTRSGAIYRSLLLPGWGQFYNREPIKGSVLVGGEVVAAGLSAMFHLLGNQAQQDYDALGLDADTSAFADLRSKASQNYQLRNIFIYTAIGIHIFGIIDATINGYDGESGSSGGPLSWTF